MYCNSGGLSYDKLIQGSKECIMTTKELILNAPLFKHVVAVRSGFTDLVAKTQAKMSVLHLNKSGVSDIRVEYGTRSDDVRDLGRMDGIFPVVYMPDREEDVIGIIMEDIS